MKPVYIIAEAGVNHNGDMHLAKKLVATASEIGADAIKFQHFIPQHLVCNATPKSTYQRCENNLEQDQRSMLETLALSNEEQAELCAYAASLHIDYLCTPFDFKSLDFLLTLDMPYLKFSSGDLTTIPLLRRGAQADIPIILSTGMAKVDEIAHALENLKDSTVHLLHCTSSYPTPVQQVNLHSIDFLRNHFNLPVGFSDHTLGTTAAIGAVARGAHIIEKHLTLDLNLAGPDHQASAEPSTFLQLITRIREIEKMMGRNDKIIQPAEEENRHIGRRSLVLINPVASGTVLTEENITAKRPAGGISPIEWERVLGAKARGDIPADTPLKWDWIEEKH